MYFSIKKREICPLPSECFRKGVFFNCLPTSWPLHILFNRFFFERSGWTLSSSSTYWGPKLQNHRHSWFHHCWLYKKRFLSWQLFGNHQISGNLPILCFFLFFGNGFSSWITNTKNWKKGKQVFFLRSAKKWMVNGSTCSLRRPGFENLRIFVWLL